MKILALEFSSPRRSVAVLDGERLLAEKSETSGESLPPLRLIDEALQAAGLDRKQVECIAVGLGPGSYSGVRGAIALAQGWQLAAGVKLTGISSTECIAVQAQEEGVVGDVKVVLDAQRGEMYAESFEISKKLLKSANDLKIVTLTELGVKGDAESMLVGPEITRWFVGGRVVFPSGAALGRLAARSKSFVSGEQLEPIYLRTTTFVKAPPARILPTL